MIRIYTMTHKKFNPPKDKMYQPLQVGREGKEDLGYLADNTADNISALNKYYSELTGFYWIWKNVHDLDYVGTCHYRRFLINEDEQVYGRIEYEKLLKEYDLITTKRVVLNNSYHFGFAANHNIKALDMTGEVIKELYPEYYESFITLVNGPETYFGNIIVCSKALFDKYASFLFSIFFQVQKRINLDTDEDSYHKRVFGFISEFLLLVFVRVNKLKVKECKVGMFGEKAETKEMKQALALYFKNKDIDGASAFFLKRRSERPDLMMEASDITGELRLCMQIIATALKERELYNINLFDKENDYSRLIKAFSELNSSIVKEKNGQKEEDGDKYKNDYLISETAINIAKIIHK